MKTARWWGGWDSNQQPWEGEREKRKREYRWGPELVPTHLPASLQLCTPKVPPDHRKGPPSRPQNSQSPTYPPPEAIVPTWPHADNSASQPAGTRCFFAAETRGGGG